MNYRRILSEHPYKQYKNNLFLRVKTSIKLLMIKNKKNDGINFSQYKYIFYIKDYGHLLRAIEFKNSILKSVDIKDILVILNSKDKKTTKDTFKYFKNIELFSISISKVDKLCFNSLSLLYALTGNIRFLFLSLNFYETGLLQYFYSNKKPSHKITLISFNDLPIDISLLSSILHRAKIINKSIVYQHGIIGAPQYYFPSKSKYFYAYSKNNYVVDYFKNHNKYNSKYIVVGNLKYGKNYKILTNKPAKNKALIVLTPKWKDLLKTFFIIDKKNCSFHLFFRLHPNMKFKLIAKILINFFNFNYDKRTKVLFQEYDLVITEVSTMGLESLAEGIPIAIIQGLNYQLPYYYDYIEIPKITKINNDSLKKAYKTCIYNKDRILKILQEYFG